MATWILGDVHGQYATLRALVDRLEFDLEHDRLWLVGDLVNRGPRSLEVLRWARQMADALGPRMVVTLGNHDLYLLALHDGQRAPRPKDEALLPILEARDRRELMGWLRHQKIFHREGSTAMVHAGLLPEWSLEEAEALARKIEQQLAKPKKAAALLDFDRAGESTSGLDELRRAFDAFSRLRLLEADGTPCSFKGRPADAPEGCLPWFRMPGRKSRGATIFFGHWAALGLFQDKGLVGLDSGAAWGGRLTAYRLEDSRLVSQEVLGA